MVTVPRCFAGETIVCVGTGPSLTREDVEFCRGRARVIAIKHAVEYAPWADVLYAAGADGSQWWQRNGEAFEGFTGLRYTLDSEAAKWAQVLRWTGFNGLETDPGALKSGKNSGYSAINLAVHLGAKRIVLLGYDQEPDAKGREHFFGAHWHKKPVPFQAFRPLFDTLIGPLAALTIQIVNASRHTALTCFPRLPLAEALA
jgi:hypothetical protein